VKRIILVMFTVLLVSAVIFSGCTTPAEPTEPTEPTEPVEPTEPTEPTEPVKPIEWRFASFIPPFDVHATTSIDWANELEEATDGRVKVNFYWSESLVKTTGLFDAVASGTADMAQPPPVYFPERFPLTQIMQLLMVFDSNRQMGQTLIALYNKYEEMREEYLPTRWLWFHGVGPVQLASTRQVQTMEDLEGLKVRTSSRFLVEGFKLLGAVPVSLAVTEAYQALETGVIDANAGDWN
jgi:TRAP-type C4-dicarboxylate transport system substrate-binding protein